MPNRFFSTLSSSEKLLLPFNLFGSLLDLVFSIPLIGRLAKWFWNSILSVIYILGGFLEFILWQAQVRPMKKLPVGFIVLSDQAGKPLVEPASIMPAIEYIQQAFLPARIKIVPAFPPPKRLYESGGEVQGLNWMRTIPSPGSSQLRTVGCNFEAILQDLGLVGSRFQYHTLRQTFHASLRRNFGFGAPVMVFVVDKMPGFGGCSMGWLSDYVTVIKRSLKTTAHELGHACNLPHHKIEDNLMNPGSIKFDSVTLTGWQIALLRASRHVSLI